MRRNRVTIPTSVNMLSFLLKTGCLLYIFLPCFAMKLVMFYLEKELGVGWN